MYDGHENDSQKFLTRTVLFCYPLIFIFFQIYELMYHLLRSLKDDSYHNYNYSYLIQIKQGMIIKTLQAHTMIGNVIKTLRKIRR
jgi:ABC-type uncharacterized transport system permease subunit